MTTDTGQLSYHISYLFLFFLKIRLPSEILQCFPDFKIYHLLYIIMIFYFKAKDKETPQFFLCCQEKQLTLLINHRLIETARLFFFRAVQRKKSEVHTFIEMCSDYCRCNFCSQKQFSVGCSFEYDCRRTLCYETVECGGARTCELKQRAWERQRRLL